MVDNELDKYPAHESHRGDAEHSINDFAELLAEYDLLLATQQSDRQIILELVYALERVVPGYRMYMADSLIIGCWMPKGKRKIVHYAGDNTGWWSGDFQVHEPTHWQPLPAPPTTSARE